MAVCGRCWICGDKFECSALKHCERCADPLRVVRNGSLGKTKICGECERDIDSGAIGSLVHALRARSSSSS